MNSELRRKGSYTMSNSSCRKLTLLAVSFLMALATVVVPARGSAEEPEIAGERARVASYIVSGPELEHVIAAVQGVGGEITHELGIINAVGARLTAAQKAALIDSDSSLRIRADSKVTTQGRRRKSSNKP
ncbi:MAG: hypothetical protein GY769_04515, partial [bacterium]|nr:hypothetical protein [bacterium]